VSAGPYIVTTKRGNPPFPNNAVLLSRVAVATLGDARKRASGVVAESALRGAPLTVLTRAALTLPESGGTITLPDGPVIEVEATTWQVLWHVSDLDAEELAGALGGIEACQQRILDAYNARQESA
jgi:hypothetical protein